jgi:hypothetical protein
LCKEDKEKFSVKLNLITEIQDQVEKKVILVFLEIANRLLVILQSKYLHFKIQTFCV